MRQSTQAASHPVLDELRASLDHVVTALGQKWAIVPLSLRPVHSPVRTSPERTFQLDGPEGLAVQVRFGVYPMGDGTYEVYVEVEDGLTCRFTYDPAGPEASAERARLGRKVTDVLLREIEPQLGRASEEPGTPSEATPVARLVLDREGAIRDVNEAACEALGYASVEALDRNFFSHVHGQNLRRVMRDLGRMVGENISRARWLLRLQTAAGRWRWFRVKALNRLSDERIISIQLHPVSSTDAIAADKVG
jgi:PAS domain S-box-containing protein